MDVKNRILKIYLHLTKDVKRSNISETKNLKKNKKNTSWCVCI